MNKRILKKKNRAYWMLFRFNGDGAIYKICSNCGFFRAANYIFGKDENGNCNFSIILEPQPNYCENCGRRMSIHPRCNNSYKKVNLDITEFYTRDVSFNEIWTNVKE